MLLLAGVGCVFGGNHVAARVAFDHGTGLMVAVLCRSGMALLVLSAMVAWQRQPLRLPEGTRGWQLVVGLLVAVQSLCLYSAVARIPVALALLVVNVFPVLLVLLTWALGGRPPSRRAAAVMGVILTGLVLALDVPRRIAESGRSDIPWGAGIALALCAATAFAIGLWITEHKLRALSGTARSFHTMAIVSTMMVLAGSTGLFTGGMAWPHDTPGWTGLAVLMVLYSAGFSVLFVAMPRLDMARNASVMNIEPIATLFMGWLVLGQWVTPVQLLGAFVVVAGIVALSRAPR
jgi:drug/metabolite transporter (DMT)-like permease